MRWPWQAEKKSLSDPSLDLLAMFGAAPSLAGIAVTPSVAMGVPAVRCAVETISQTLGQLPVHLYQRATRERLQDHPAEALMNRISNEWTAASDFKAQMVMDALFYGDGLAAIVRANGKPVELVRYQPGAVSIGQDSYGGPTYTQGAISLNRADIFHLRASSICGYRGESAVQQAKDAISLAILLEKHGAKLFGSGARPGGVIEIPESAGEGALAKIRAAWKLSHEGSDNAGRTSILAEGATFKPLTFSSVDAQYLELRKFAIAEIARAFNIPSTFLGDLDRATWSNLESLNRQFLQLTLLPWIKRFEGEISLKLLTPDERDTLYAEFVTDSLLRADFAARFAGYSQAITAQILNPNEVRAKENLPPYQGGEVYANPNTTASTNTKPGAAA